MEDEWINDLLTKLAPLTTTNSFSDLQDIFMPATDFESAMDCNSLFSRSLSTSSASSTPAVKKEEEYECPEGKEMLDKLTSKLQQMQRRNDLTPKALESIFDTKDVLLDSVESESVSPATKVATPEVSRRRRCSRKRLTASQKEAHNKVEKKYRVNINAKINCLQTVIPWIAADSMDSKVCKSAVLEKAYDYITHLQAENAALRSRLGEWES